MIEERFVEFEGAFNVRDLGGLPAADGRTVRRGRIYRADSPLGLTDADRMRVAELDVMQVVDLRSGEEAEEGTWAVAPQMQRQVFEIMDPATHPNNPAAPEMAPIATHEEFAQRYLRRLTSGGPKLVEAARVVIDRADDGVIFHCSAGKDRTGLLAAFLLSAVGVDRELIVADYAASDEPMQRKFEFHSANPDSLRFDLTKVPPLMLRSPAPVMERLLDLADEHFGGLVASFQQHGFSDDELVALNNAITE